MEFIIIAGIATFINVVVLKWKIERERYIDFIMDITVLLALNFLFMGTMTGLSIAMLASALFSIYLVFFPPRFSTSLMDELNKLKNT